VTDKNHTKIALSQIATLEQLIDKAPARSASEVSKRRAIGILAPKLYELRSKGYRWRDVAAWLTENGLAVTVPALQRHLRGVKAPSGTTRDDVIALAPVLAARGRKAVDEATGETVEEYVDRWLAERVARGIASARLHDRGRLRKHAFPIFGLLEARTFGREDVERFVTDLDRKIRLDVEDDEHLSWKTASNVWVLVSKMCKDMVDAKRRELRVRDDNPAARVHPPERGEARAKNYLYPSEFRRLVECQAIRVKFRMLYAVAVYTYARGGELAALEWSDVDLEHGIIHITKSVDAETRKVKSTKTGTTRRVPIEPELRPLLQRLHDERRGTTGGRVLWLPHHEDRAVLMREHLRVAGVERAELFANDTGHKHVTFHDLRATGITWAAVRGDDPLRIKQRAGHKAFSTTEVYIREAENLRDGFGSAFPHLPPDLLGTAPSDAATDRFRSGSSMSLRIPSTRDIATLPCRTTSLSSATFQPSNLTHRRMDGRLGDDRKSIGMTSKAPSLSQPLEIANLFLRPVETWLRAYRIGGLCWASRTIAEELLSLGDEDRRARGDPREELREVIDEHERQGLGLIDAQSEECGGASGLHGSDGPRRRHDHRDVESDENTEGFHKREVDAERVCRRPNRDRLPEPRQRRNREGEQHHSRRAKLFDPGAKRLIDARKAGPRLRRVPAPAEHDHHRRPRCEKEREEAERLVKPARNGARHRENEEDREPPPPIEPTIDDLGAKNGCAAFARSPRQVLHAQNVAPAGGEESVEHHPDDLRAVRLTITKREQRSHDEMPAQRLKSEHDEARGDAAGDHLRRDARDVPERVGRLHAQPPAREYGQGDACPQPEKSARSSGDRSRPRRRRARQRYSGGQGHLREISAPNAPASVREKGTRRGPGPPAQKRRWPEHVGRPRHGQLEGKDRLHRCAREYALAERAVVNALP
jgi:integrase